MKETALKYGCNPNQKPARIYMENGSELPVEILCGNPGYINFLDAFNAWQLVSELKKATGRASATSFKHVSPTSASIGKPLSAELKRAVFADDIEGLDDSETACAYVRARGTDRMSSFGDFIALSDVCDETTASVIKREVSDGIIAPGYTDKALELLRSKRKGAYNIIRIDPSYVPDPVERKQVFGVTFEQGRNNIVIDASCFENIVTENRNMTKEAVDDLLVAMITLKYTQSNSVCYAVDGQAIGVGAGQQSRIHCTRLAGNKADFWNLRRHEKVLNLPFTDGLKPVDKDNAIDLYIGGGKDAETIPQELFKHTPEPLTEKEKYDFLSSLRGISLASDAFFPFGDNIDRAYRSGVDFVAQTGGSIRDSLVIEAANRHNMVMAFTGIRLFHH